MSYMNGFYADHQSYRRPRVAPLPGTILGSPLLVCFETISVRQANDGS